MEAYQQEQEKDKYLKMIEYGFAMILKALIWVATMVVKIIFKVIEGVLKTLGLPVPKLR